MFSCHGHFTLVPPFWHLLRDTLCSAALEKSFVPSHGHVLSLTGSLHSWSMFSCQGHFTLVPPSWHLVSELESFVPTRSHVLSLPGTTSPSNTGTGIHLVCLWRLLFHAADCDTWTWRWKKSSANFHGLNVSSRLSGRTSVRAPVVWTLSWYFYLRLNRW